MRARAKVCRPRISAMRTIAPRGRPRGTPRRGRAGRRSRARAAVPPGATPVRCRRRGRGGVAGTVAAPRARRPRCPRRPRRRRSATSTSPVRPRRRRRWRGTRGARCSRGARGRPASRRPRPGRWRSRSRCSRPTPPPGSRRRRCAPPRCARRGEVVVVHVVVGRHVARLPLCRRVSVGETTSGTSPSCARWALTSVTTWAARSARSAGQFAAGTQLPAAVAAAGVPATAAALSSAASMMIGRRAKRRAGTGGRRTYRRLGTRPCPYAMRGWKRATRRRAQRDRWIAGLAQAVAASGPTPGRSCSMCVSAW